MRAALYSRYSTGNQSPLSIEDQLRLCRQLATKLGAKVVREFTDAEVSGFVSDARPGVNALLDFARRGDCDIVEDLSSALDVPETEERAARDAIRALIQQVRFTPRETAGEYELEIVGDLAPILHLNNKKAPSEEGAFCRTEDQSQRRLGAGTGFEPVTFRL